jgi:hypothetical protein
MIVVYGVHIIRLLAILLLEAISPESSVIVARAEQK